MGFTFKENCPDTRNTKVIDIYKELGEYGITPIVVDPAADADEAKRLYGITFETMDAVKGMDAVVIAVAHKQFLSYTKEQISGFFNPSYEKKVLMDIKESLTGKNIFLMIIFIGDYRMSKRAEQTDSNKKWWISFCYWQLCSYFLKECF